MRCLRTKGSLPPSKRIWQKITDFAGAMVLLAPPIPHPDRDIRIVVAVLPNVPYDGAITTWQATIGRPPSTVACFNRDLCDRVLSLDGVRRPDCTEHYCCRLQRTKSVGPKLDFPGSQVATYRALS